MKPRSGSGLGAPQPFTVGELNPQVAIANLSLAESESARDVSRAALLPQVSIGASDFVTRANTEALFGSPNIPVDVVMTILP